MIYLDAAATTLQKPRQVRAAVARAVRTLASPGRGGYRAATDAAELVYDCRCAAASLFEAEPEQVVFTMHATHALNLAIRSVVRPGDEVVISGMEHNAVVRPLYAAGARIAVASAPPFDRLAAIDAFDRCTSGRTRCVVCTMVSNVFGSPQPVREIAQIAHAAGAKLILDASQAAGVLPVSLRGLGADYIAMPGHKGLYGPQGTGLLLCRAGGEPLLAGGTGTQSVPPGMPPELPERLEAGTANVCGIAGLLAGLRFVSRVGTARIAQRERALRALLVSQLGDAPGLRLFMGEGQTGVLSVRTLTQDCESAAAALAARGVCTRAGLHCAPLAHLTAGTERTGTLRLSASYFNTPAEVRRAAKILRRICE